MFRCNQKISNFILVTCYLLLFAFVPLVFATDGTTAAPQCKPPTCEGCATVAGEAECRRETLFGPTGAGYATGAKTATISGRIGIVIDTVMSVTGIMFLAIVVFSGIQWMGAGGNEEIVKKAKTRITRATVGLIIVVGSWAIVNFVLKGLFFPEEAPGGAIQIKTYP